jgi:hypothetical protein
MWKIIIILFGMVFLASAARVLHRPQASFDFHDNKFHPRPPAADRRDR